MILIVFWTSFLLLLYTFIGYPLLLRVIAAFMPKHHNIYESCQPSVSIVLSVYNEEAVIRQKIENFLALDYPDDKLEFIIISDCCDDRTEEIIRAFSNPRIKLLVQTERSGKTKNLNRGVADAQGDIIIFTDANSIFNRDAVAKLVRHFADPSIGLVSGKSVYFDPATGNTSTGGAFRRYEDFIKSSESRIVSIIGADGAIYALRETLYEPLRPEFINDFLHTIQVVIKGYRAISDDDAICREETVEGGGGEFRRQTRIMAQSWLIFSTQIGLLLKSGKFLYAWQLINHKFIRWVTIPVMALLLISSGLLADEQTLPMIVFTILVVFLIMGVLGHYVKLRGLEIPYLFLIVHCAAISGFFIWIRGGTVATWNVRQG